MSWVGFQFRIYITEVFGSTGFENNGFSGIANILAIPQLRFCIKKAQSNGFPGIMDKMAIPNWSGTSENLCTSCGKLNLNHKTLGSNAKNVKRYSKNFDFEYFLGQNLKIAWRIILAAIHHKQFSYDLN